MLILSLATLAGAASASTEIGAFVGNADHVAPTAAEVNNFEDLAQRHLSSVLVYWAWNDGDFPAAGLNSGVRFHDGYDTKTVLHLTWEPWSRLGGNDSTYPLTGIINGDFDPYITKFAQDTAAWGDPIRLRLMHEMIQDNNPNTPGWYPWQDNPTLYVQAYSHIWNIFQNQGASNVEFVWAPNDFPFDLATLAPYYPGADKVAWLGMDGYNPGEDDLPGYPYWKNFDDIFFNLYHLYLNNPQVFGDKPIMIAEFASAEMGGSKEVWMDQAFQRMQSAYPEIAAFYWFNKLKESDWRVDSSPESLFAFQAAMQDAYFTSHPVIPEPTTMILFGAGIAGILLRILRRK
jgi:beta-mannanase